MTTVIFITFAKSEDIKIGAPKLPEVKKVREFYLKVSNMSKTIESDEK